LFDLGIVPWYILILEGVGGARDFEFKLPTFLQHFYAIVVVFYLDGFFFRSPKHLAYPIGYFKSMFGRLPMAQIMLHLQN